MELQWDIQLLRFLVFHLHPSGEDSLNPCSEEILFLHEDFYETESCLTFPLWMCINLFHGAAILF